MVRSRYDIDPALCLSTPCMITKTTYEFGKDQNHPFWSECRMKNYDYDLKEYHISCDLTGENN